MKDWQIIVGLDKPQGRLVVEGVCGLERVDYLLLVAKIGAQLSLSQDAAVADVGRKVAEALGKKDGG